MPPRVRRVASGVPIGSVLSLSPDQSAFARGVPRVHFASSHRGETGRRVPVRRPREAPVAATGGHGPERGPPPPAAASYGGSAGACSARPDGRRMSCRRAATTQHSTELSQPQMSCRAATEQPLTDLPQPQPRPAPQQIKGRRRLFCCTKTRVLRTIQSEATHTQFTHALFTRPHARKHAQKTNQPDAPSNAGGSASGLPSPRPPQNVIPRSTAAPPSRGRSCRS